MESATLAIFSILLYLPTLRYDFLSDDFPLIVQNPRILNWDGFWDTIFQPFFAFPTHPYLHYWRPFTLVTYVVDHTVWGFAPCGYHMMNLLLNTTCVLLLWFILRKFNPRSLTPLIASFLFLIHPAHIENVAWISGRTDLLAFLFLTLSLLLFYEFRRQPERKWRVGASLLFFVMALLSKETAVFFPFALFFAFDEKSLRLRLVRLAPYVAAILIYLPLHQRAASSLALAKHLGWEDIPLAIQSAGALVRILFNPVFPGPHFPMREFAATSLLYYVLAALGLVIMGIIIRFRAQFPLTFCALPLLVFMLPSLLPRFVPSYPPIAQRFVYLSTPLAAVFFAEIIAWLHRKNFKLPALIFLLLVTIPWTIAVHSQLPLFQDERTYFQKMATLYPEEEHFTMQLALKEAHDGRLPVALALLEKGLAHNKDNPWIDYSRNGRIFRANLLIVVGRLNEGELEIDSLLSTQSTPEERYYINLLKAVARKRRGDLAGALQAINRASEHGVTADLMTQKAEVHALLGQKSESVAAIKDAMRLGLEPERIRRLNDFLAKQESNQAPQRSP